MKTWLAGGAAVTLAGIGYYFVATPQELAVPSPQPETVVHVPLEKPAEARPATIVLDRVIDVSNLDHLLEPPPAPPAESAPSGPIITRVGFEEAAESSPRPTDAPPIPRSE